MEYTITFVFSYFIRNVTGTYILYPAPVDFLQAVQMCDSINATVAFIHNSTQDDFIKNTYLNNASVALGIWLAIYDFIGNEINVNYYNNQSLHWKNWASGQPNGLLELCTRYEQMSYQGWGDVMCSSFFSVLCESGFELSSSVTEVVAKAVESSTIDPTSIITLQTMKTSVTIIQSSTIMTTLKTITKSSITLTTPESSTLRTNIIDVPFWNEWNPWSFCQLRRQRNNSRMYNGTEYEILNVSCSLAFSNNETQNLVEKRETDKIIKMNEIQNKTLAALEKLKESHQINLKIKSSFSIFAIIFIVGLIFLLISSDLCRLFSFSRKHKRTKRIKQVLENIDINRNQSKNNKDRRNFMINIDTRVLNFELRKQPRKVLE